MRSCTKPVRAETGIAISREAPLKEKCRKYSRRHCRETLRNENHISIDRFLSATVLLLIPFRIPQAQAQHLRAGCVEKYEAYLSNNDRRLALCGQSGWAHYLFISWGRGLHSWDFPPY
jgi:hypothetical protein